MPGMDEIIWNEKECDLHDLETSFGAELGRAKGLPEQKGGSVNLGLLQVMSLQRNLFLFSSLVGNPELRKRGIQHFSQPSATLLVQLSLPLTWLPAVTSELVSLIPPVASYCSVSTNLSQIRSLICSKPSSGFLVLSKNLNLWGPIWTGIPWYLSHYISCFFSLCSLYSSHTDILVVP